MNTSGSATLTKAAKQFNIVFSLLNNHVGLSITLMLFGVLIKTSNLQCDEFETVVKSPFSISNQHGPMIFLCVTKVSNTVAFVPKTCEKVSPSKSGGNLILAFFGGWNGKRSFKYSFSLGIPGISNAYFLTSGLAFKDSSPNLSIIKGDISSWTSMAETGSSEISPPINLKSLALISGFTFKSIVLTGALEILIEPLLSLFFDLVGDESKFSYDTSGTSKSSSKFISFFTLLDFLIIEECFVPETLNKPPLDEFLNRLAQRGADGNPIDIQHTATDKTNLIITQTSNSLTDFANEVDLLERSINMLGTRRDSSQLRTDIETVQFRKLSEYKTTLQNLVTDISNLNLLSQEKFKVEKLNKEFEGISERLSSLKRLFTGRANSILINEHVNSLDKSNQVDEATPLIPNQQLQQQVYTITQQELDSHVLLAEERANEIQRIHGGIEEVNVIYKQLGSLVQQQGTQVDTIENNLSNLKVQTKNASEELRKAHQYQKNKSKWSCIILLVLGIFSLILILVVLS
ncbi:hypothetical protein WICMUC_004257 [Wickerhamomyces mucosus]|uniref:t-SNARE coiled-coil homology domain-containing protein n=1 Tax=Wickerhamomyces mucosus TaxID=1378264 RepID=A0A9P8TAZ0_9ASCO|nr:hypothetical protein WICMUC_004257 [Wickerhamomyces mucosus]